MIPQEPAVGRNPIPKVRIWGVPVQLVVHIRNVSKISFQQIILRTEGKRNLLLVCAQQHPAGHIHKLSSQLCGTVTTISGPKAEAACAALGVPSIQVEGSQLALVTLRALHIFLTLTLRSGWVTDACLRALLVTVTAPAVWVIVVASSTALTPATNDVRLARALSVLQVTPRLYQLLDS